MSLLEEEKQEQQLNPLNMERGDDTSDVNGTDQSCCRKVRPFLRQNMTMILTLVGICLGFGLGLLIQQCDPSEDVILWVGMPGNLYMCLLKMTIMPLVVCSVIAGASSMDTKTSGKIGVFTVALAILTHLIGCLLSSGLVFLIKPGSQSHGESTTRQLTKAMKTHDIFADFLRNLMPDNIVEATFRQSVTKYVLEDDSQAKNPLTTLNKTQNTSNETRHNTREGTDKNTAVQNYIRVVSHSNGINVLGLITISAVFGIAAGKVKHRVPHFLSFVENVLELVLIIVRWFFLLTPIGVLSLIANSISQVDDILQTFSDLGLFVLTVIMGLLIHWVLILPVMYFVVVRKNPLPFFIAQFSAVSIAFASTTSSAAMPAMFDVCENRFHMDQRVTRIAIPITTMNADGSAIFIVTACMFISDYSGVDITSEIIINILLLGIVSALAIPGVPSASIFTVIIILTAIQVPLENIAILFAVEWLLDRIRTGLNVVSHLTIVACTDAFCKKTIQQLDARELDGTTALDNKDHNGDTTLDSKHVDGGDVVRA